MVVVHCWHSSCPLWGERAIDYLNTRPRLYVLDGFAGWDPEFRYKFLGMKLLILIDHLSINIHERYSSYKSHKVHNLVFWMRAELVLSLSWTSKTLQGSGSLPVVPITPFSCTTCWSALRKKSLPNLAPQFLVLASDTPATLNCSLSRRTLFLTWFSWAYIFWSSECAKRDDKAWS